MKFSIITVCYNSEKTIEETLKSIDQQIFTDYEHLIVDGNSSDRTIEICNKSANKKRKIFSENDNGIFDAMNKGIKKSNGDYLIFLNSDDKFYDCEVLYKINKNINGECLLYGNIIMTKNGRLHRTWLSGNFDRIKLKKGWMPPHTGTFMSRKLILENKIFYNLKYSISADYDYLIKCINFSQKIKYVNIFVTNMKYGGNSNSNIINSIKKKYEDFLIINDNKIGGIYTLLLKSFTKLNQLIF